MLRRCIVVFAQDALGERDAAAKDRDRDPQRYGALDTIAEGGTSGLLAWRRSRAEGAPFPSEREQIAQVLGIWEDARREGSDDPTTTLREEYKGAECHLLTNSRDARDAFASAFAKSEVYGSASPNGSPSTSADLLSALDDSLRDEADLVFVHLLLASSSEEENGNGPSSDPLGALNRVVRRILDAHADDSTLLVVIAADGQNQGSNGIESLTRGEAKATEVRPIPTTIPTSVPNLSHSHSHSLSPPLSPSSDREPGSQPGALRAEAEL